MHRHTGFILLCISAALFISISMVVAEGNPKNARVVEGYGKLPLSFVENRGQLDEQVRYVIRGPRASAFFRDDGVTFDLWDAADDSQSTTIRQQDPMNGLAAHRSGKNRKSSLLRESTSSGVRTHAVLKLTFEGISPDCRVEGMDELPGKVNYLVGKDSSKWHTDISAFKGVAYRDVWPGIDVLYHGDRRQLKYDIRVNPGVELKSIHLRYEGAEEIRLDKAGDLHIKTAVTEFVERVPGIYQEKNGKKIPVKGGYVLLDAQTVGFKADGMKPNLPLVIDPASDLVYSTYLGGSYIGAASGISVDSTGCAYIVGATSATDFPVTPGAFQVSFGGAADISVPADVFVAKLNASGSALVYSTYLGGLSNDSAGDMAVDSSGCAYIVGESGSPDFPITAGAFRTEPFGGFVVKLNPLGSGLIYSTFISPNIAINSIAVDTSGCAYISGGAVTADLPTTPGAYQTEYKGNGPDVWWAGDAFVSKLNPAGAGLVYSTFLGGSGDGEEAYDIAVDSSGCAYVTGWVFSTDFPTTPGAFQETFVGGHRSDTIGVEPDVFVTKLNPSGTDLVYSSFLGGDGWDDCHAIAVDANGCAYVAGSTGSADFPVTLGAFDTTNDGLSNGYMSGFVTKVNPTGSALVYSTYLVGNGGASANGIAVDSNGSALIVGRAVVDFLTTPGAFQGSVKARSDAFLTKLNSAGDGLIYSTLLGGGMEDSASAVAVQPNGCAYIAGITLSTDFPTTSSAYQPCGKGGHMDAFVAKFNMGDALPVNIGLSPRTGTVPPSIRTRFTSTYSDADGYADLSRCILLLNTTFGVSRNSVYLLYDQRQNKLYLRNDEGTAWLGGFEPGSARTIQNSQCRLFCGGTRVTASGDRLTVEWQLEIRPSLAGKMLQEWLYVSDSMGMTDGWDRFGTIMVCRRRVM